MQSGYRRKESLPSGLGREGEALARLVAEVEKSVDPARARLVAALRRLEADLAALDQLRDPRFAGVLEALAVLRAEIVAAIAALEPD